MWLQNKIILVVLCTAVLWGCLHKPPPLKTPTVPVIEYGKPGVVTR